MNNRYMALADHSSYAMEPLEHRVGDLVTFMGGAFQIAMVIDVVIPIYPDWPTGRHFALRQRDWPRVQHLIVPESALDQARELVA
jgi:hypothetical protein